MFCRAGVGCAVAFTIRKISRKAASASVIVCRFGNEIAEERSESESDNIAPRTLEEVVVAVRKVPISRNSRQR